MRERPILFSGCMVRAILEGRKTQTRRAIKLKTGDTFDEHALKAAIQEWRPMYDKVAQKVVGKIAAVIHCPYGKPGDRLWVRETWSATRWPYSQGVFLSYRADPQGTQGIAYQGPTHTGFKSSGSRRKWRPSIHMPRWASQLLLEVTDVRIERLQEISEADARAEGLAAISKDGELFKHGIPDLDGLPGTDDQGWPWKQWHTDPRQAYRQLWDSINGRRHIERDDDGNEIAQHDLSWSANPWVWVVEFRVAEPSEVAA